MTVKGHSELPKSAHRLMARLMELHLRTHPKRVGAKFGVNAKYVRQLWCSMSVQEMASLNDALSELERMQ